MTDIEWTDESWNPIVGCSIESPGCKNCYAMRKAHRLAEISRGPAKGAHGVAHYRDLTKTVNGSIVWNDRVHRAPEKLQLKPLRWRKPRMIFVNSMGDLFHERIPDHEIDRIFAIMALCPQHIFQVLTKRASRMRDYFQDMTQRENEIGAQVLEVSADSVLLRNALPLKNVWLGVSAEDQKRANERIPDLLQTPAALRFVSLEPLIGEIDLERIECGNNQYDALSGDGVELNGGQPYHHSGPKLDWIIAGGESGPGARPPHPDWFRSLRDQCAAAGAPFFFKQWGSWAPVADPANFAAPREKLRIVPARDGCDISEEKLMINLGKANTGARLDGRDHRDMPAPRQSEAA